MSKGEHERSHKFFAFLRRLRANGRTNMYGAVPYLMRAFGLDRERAFRIVCDWVDQQEAEAAEAAPPVPAEAVARAPRRPAVVRRKRPSSRRAA